MNLSPIGVPLHRRLTPETLMRDDELMALCAANEILRVERDANGEVIVMTRQAPQVATEYVDQHGSQYLGTAQWRCKAFDSSIGLTLH